MDMEKTDMEKTDKKKGFWQTMLDIINEANIKVEKYQQKVIIKQIHKEMKKEEKEKTYKE